MNRKIAAIVPAAGVGSRFGGKTKKPYHKICGVPLLICTLRVLEQIPSIHWIIIAVERPELARAGRLIRRYGLKKVMQPVEGGAQRAESVVRALACVPEAAKWVLVHDAARPCVSRVLVERTAQTAFRYGAACAALPASVTVKEVDAFRRVGRTLERRRLWLVQTPQVFRKQWFADAAKRARSRWKQFPDDASMLEAAGYPVRVVEGDPWNMKVTMKEDAIVAEAILRQRRDSV